MRRTSGLLSGLLTAFIIIFLLRSGIIFDLFLFVIILIALIFGGIFLYSLFKDKKININIPKSKKEDSPKIDKLSSYFGNYKELPINDVITLQNGFFYSSYDSLCLTYKGEIIDKLADIKNDNYSLYEKVLNKVNEYSLLSDEALNAKSKEVKNDYIKPNIEPKEIDISKIVGSQVIKPELKDVNIKDRYSEYVLELLNSIDYGQDNSKEYCEGHKKALDKYFMEIKNNSRNIESILEKLNNEISGWKNKTSINDKGYYDGMFYVLKATKKAKKVFLDKANMEL